jgi:hypothetical protein
MLSHTAFVEPSFAGAAPALRGSAAGERPMRLRLRDPKPTWARVGSSPAAKNPGAVWSAVLDARSLRSAQETSARWTRF